MNIKHNLILIMMFLLMLSCSYIPEDHHGSEVLRDGLWLVYVDTPGFGKFVDIDKEIALIGAPNDSVASAHIFEYSDNDWIYTASYYCEDSVQNGYAKDIAVNNGIIAISDYDNNKIFTYKKTDSTWIKLNTITSPDINIFTDFGYSIDLYEDCLVVGSTTGPVLLYKNINNEWIEQARINAGINQDINREIDVCISESFIGIFKTRVYTYERSEAGNNNKIELDSLSSYDFSINIYDNTLVVGNVELALDVKGIVIYEYSDHQWTKVQEIEGSLRNSFGPSVGINSDYILFCEKGHIPPIGSNDYSFYSHSDYTLKEWTLKKQLNYFGSKDVALSDEYAILGGANCARIYKYR